jgi:hypothetical protein
MTHDEVMIFAGLIIFLFFIVTIIFITKEQ